MGSFLFPLDLEPFLSFQYFTLQQCNQWKLQEIKSTLIRENLTTPLGTEPAIQGQTSLSFRKNKQPTGCGGRPAVTKTFCDKLSDKVPQTNTKHNIAPSTDALVTGRVFQWHL
ncbi:hypothetical protein NQ317_006128 [Molorchus minor]|uniref:Uncharacterized protein n=1 Tax=Molorchus minor TaxID=1323400 RepID=A0ABQ9IXM4_9CUCU|nr:hypothetical protein NQ317_006128 [Molorchus minor]